MFSNPRIAVIGAGAVGMGTLDALLNRYDFYGDVDCVAMATRRPDAVSSQLFKDGIDTPVVDYDGIIAMADEIDVAVLADSSQSLLTKAPSWLKYFNTADSCDFHGNFGSYVDSDGVHQRGYVKDMAAAAKDNGRLASIGFGWDPGDTFSPIKQRGASVFPGAVTNVFYGPGKSQGHTTALKTEDMRKRGVVDAIQFTMPNDDIMARAQHGEMREFTAGERMWRDCYLLVREDADKDAIAEAIRAMPGYYADYPRVDVSFVSKSGLGELQKDVSHQGTIITTGETKRGNGIVEEFKCRYKNNAEATGCLLAGAAVGTVKAYEAGQRGVIIPGSDIRNLSSPLCYDEIVQKGL